MRDETGVRGVKSAAGAALLESMRVAQRESMQPPGLSREQLVTQLQEWQQLVTELARGAARGAELATLYELIGVLNSTLDLTETLGLVMVSLICWSLLGSYPNVRVPTASVIWV